MIMSEETCMVSESDAWDDSFKLESEEDVGGGLQRSLCRPRSMACIISLRFFVALPADARGIHPPLQSCSPHRAHRHRIIDAVSRDPPSADEGGYSKDL